MLCLVSFFNLCYLSFSVSCVNAQVILSGGLYSCREKPANVDLTLALNFSSFLVKEFGTLRSAESVVLRVLVDLNKGGAMDTHRGHLIPSIVSHQEGETVVEHEFAMDPTDTTLPVVLKLLEELKSPVPQCTLLRGGATGYLDYVRPEDVSASVSRGVDPHGRPFVALRVEEQCEERTKLRVVVYHRRYESGSLWVLAGAPVFGGARTPQEELQLLHNLLVGGKVIHKDITYALA